MSYRFSGHESFPCRYPWLPKAYNALLEDPNLFRDDNSAMVRLGVGKNMVRSIRFWVQVFGVASQLADEQGLYITPFGASIFGEDGYDPFLEDVRTLWLLHWKISTINDDPLFAWYYLLNKWSEREFSQKEILDAFAKEAERESRILSYTTLAQHFDIFLHTYLPARSRSRLLSEETLDSPLTELKLITYIGEKLGTEPGSREPRYAFRQDSKLDITGRLFAYCVLDYWKKNRSEEQSLSFSELASATFGVGATFKLSEADLRYRLDSITEDSSGLFEYRSSAAIPRVISRRPIMADEEADLLLGQIYNLQAERQEQAPALLA